MKMKLWSDRIIQFYNHIKASLQLPDEVEVLMPFSDEHVLQSFYAFYKKFYADNEKRYIILGINPGRFGGGVTGIPFTDPIRLEKDCNIKNDFVKRQELSSVFMYEMMRAFGGVESFYKNFYISSYSPLGFVRHGKNLNYYDDKALALAIETFAVACLQEQLTWPIHRDVAFCLGDGKNFLWLSKLNAKHQFFEKIIPLSHPRFIMQYKLKQKEEYIDKYLEALKLDYIDL
jgi:hypothetical protein